MQDDLYRREYTKEFVSRWDDLIGWEGRREGENGFFEQLLEENNCRSVADVAAGTGYHAITLAEAGFDAVAADGSANMIEQTKANAERLGVKLAGAKMCEWQNLDKTFGAEAFDAMVCLGNAFTHLFDHDERVDALKAMYRALKPGGVLVIDQRNYDAMLEEGYSSKHKHYYTGDGVEARPVELSEDKVRFEYSYPDGAKHYLTMFPLRREYLSGLMREVGFRPVICYGDFEENFDADDVDFFQQVAFKPKAANGNGRH
ncbi:class I SAM-dependent methyltransferase [Kaustia mangrovi]|uniref:Class I SAM-dependent methyltransferase n=1 Tax=Kaustia mangrovi TaxID=2593653 RepID=A0A7S8C733_9HYPH|nr:class I SAM-dependent methyltransferase [Kaustia mangrovi]QPC44389.1 class I SAM-dependent methyltransferase [Kaustia mangrovi]